MSDTPTETEPVEPDTEVPEGDEDTEDESPPS